MLISLWFTSRIVLESWLFVGWVKTCKLPIFELGRSLIQRNFELKLPSVKILEAIASRGDFWAEAPECVYAIASLGGVLFVSHRVLCLGSRRR